MRVGKKVEAKKTRPCVVRLEKVDSPPRKMTRGGVTITSSGKLKAVPSQDDKKFKGPLKKRPVTQMVATPRPRAKYAPRKVNNSGESSESEDEDEEEEELPPTIAASRSRRAIKPNPKYASEDMVTPKIVKNVAMLGNSNARKYASSTKQTKNSESSSEDFYNKESSDEMGGHHATTPIVDKAYRKDLDSNFSDIDTPTPPTVPRKRGRPRKTPLTDATQSATTPQSAARPTPTVRTPPSQLQQLRRTIANNAHGKLSESSTTKKRKLDDDYGVPFEVLGKRMGNQSISKSSVGAKAAKDGQSNHSQFSMRRSLPNHIVNGNKILDTKASDDEHSGDVPAAKRRTLALTTLNRNSGASNKISLAQSKQRSSSPAIVKGTKGGTTTTEDGAGTSLIKKSQQSPSGTADDFEVMPTFTIVNINDIINKKGDVLISQAGVKASTLKTSVTLPTLNNTSSQSAIVEGKLSRRKTGHTTILSEKIDPERLRNPQQRTPFPPKKPPQTILNHTFQKKGASKEIGVKTTEKMKPAPRILNSMVAKKTQPIKPMIANLEDSADESIPLSVEEEDDDEYGRADDKFNSDVRKSKKDSASVVNTTSKTPLALNTHGIINRQVLKTMDKVVISRQGDKIIKKMTCFETWYVLNQPDEAEPKLKFVRNMLEIPLIKLANAAKTITLPSASWSSKVTLFELSQSTLAKATTATYTGDLEEHNIAEEDRAKFQPTCVMFRRAVTDRTKSRLPYDRAVIFKNRTFFTNIEGKNVKLVAAPTSIRTHVDIEILLDIIDVMTLHHSLVELAHTTQ